MGDVTINIGLVILIGITAVLVVALTAILTTAAMQARNERRFNDWLQRRQDRGQTRKPVSPGRWGYRPRRKDPIDWSPPPVHDRRDDVPDDII